MKTSKKDTLSGMVQALKKVYPNGPSWPFRTESARTVWDFAEKVFTKNPKLGLYQVVQQAFEESGIPANELTPDDYNTLATALRWKSFMLTGSDAPPKLSLPTVLPSLTR